MLKEIRNNWIQSRRYPSSEGFQSSRHISQWSSTKKSFLIGAGILAVVAAAAFFLALKIALIITAVALAAVAIFGTYIFLRKKMGR